MFTAHCIKCKAEYESPDEDDYYCDSCLEEKRSVAKELDKKFAHRVIDIPKPRFSEKDFQGSKGRIFFNAKDLL